MGGKDESSNRGGVGWAEKTTRAQVWAHACRICGHASTLCWAVECIQNVIPYCIYWNKFHIECMRSHTRHPVVCVFENTCARYPLVCIHWICLWGHFDIILIPIVKIVHNDHYHSDDVIYYSLHLLTICKKQQHWFSRHDISYWTSVRRNMQLVYTAAWQ